MKTIKSVNVGSFVLYGAVLAAFWTFAFGLWYWVLGWIFGAQSWWIDMNLVNWSAYTFIDVHDCVLAQLDQRHGRRVGWLACCIGIQRRGRHDGWS